jgi:hypothetical protein
MQLYQEGILQGITVNAIPGADRPKNLDGTMVGDIGFDPLGFSNWLNLNWAREAEIKHGRVAMLAATGMIVQDIAVIPGFDKEFSGAAMMKLHNLAVQQVLSLHCSLSRAGAPPWACTSGGELLCCVGRCCIGQDENSCLSQALGSLESRGRPASTRGAGE